MYEFMRGQADDFVGHAGRRYVAFFGTLFIFVLFCNLIGVIPGTDAPTMYPFVPLAAPSRRFCTTTSLAFRRTVLGNT